MKIAFPKYYYDGNSLREYQEGDHLFMWMNVEISQTLYIDGGNDFMKIQQNVRNCMVPAPFCCQIVLNPPLGKPTDLWNFSGAVLLQPIPNTAVPVDDGTTLTGGVVCEVTVNNVASGTEFGTSSYLSTPLQVADMKFTEIDVPIVSLYDIDEEVRVITTESPTRRRGRSRNKGKRV